MPTDSTRHPGSQVHITSDPEGGRSYPKRRRPNGTGGNKGITVLCREDEYDLIKWASLHLRIGMGPWLAELGAKAAGRLKKKAEKDRQASE